MTEVGGVAAERLRALVERIERLEEERGNIAADIRGIYAEAGSAGFDKQALRQIVRLRKMPAEDRRAREELVDLYCRALGI